MTLLSTASVTAELRAELARRRLTTARLAEDLGVTQMWLSRRLRGITPLTIDDTGRICAALDLDPATLFAPATTAETAAP